MRTLKQSKVFCLSHESSRPGADKLEGYRIHIGFTTEYINAIQTNNTYVIAQFGWYEFLAIPFSRALQCFCYFTLFSVDYLSSKA